MKEYDTIYQDICRSAAMHPSVEYKLNKVVKEGFPIDFIPYGKSDTLLIHFLKGTSSVGDIEAILSHTPDINKPDSDGNTPLMCLMSSKGLYLGEKMFLEFLSRGADINAQNKNKETALTKIFAYLCKSPEYMLQGHSNFQIADFARLLLKHGADPNIPDVYGHNLIMQILDGEKLFRVVPEDIIMDIITKSKDIIYKKQLKDDGLRISIWDILYTKYLTAQFETEKVRAKIIAILKYISELGYSIDAKNVLLYKEYDKSDIREAQEELKKEVKRIAIREEQKLEFCNNNDSSCYEYEI